MSSIIIGQWLFFVMTPPAALLTIIIGTRTDRICAGIFLMYVIALWLTFGRI